MNLFGFFKRDAPSCRVEMFLSDGTPVTAKTIAWVEGSVARANALEEDLRRQIKDLNSELESKEQGLRIAYDFLISNSCRESHAGRIAGVIRRILGGRVQLVGLEHSLRARIEAGIVITKEDLNP